MINKHKDIRVKPEIPPKPKFVVNQKKLPHPPRSHDLNDILKNVKNEDVQLLRDNSQEVIDWKAANIYDEDGYLKSSSSQCSSSRLGYSTNQNAQTRHNSIKTGDSWKKNHQFEAPEFSETSSAIDVRQRPLPQLPGEKPLLSDRPWYKPIDRRKGENLIMNGVDGCFLVRPSSKGQNCYTLTLWFQGRSYNIPIRQRDDGLYSLGTPKQLEKCFKTIEEMVNNYHREELILFSNGIETGRTILTIYPS